jgi:hypothetical protein
MMEWMERMHQTMQATLLGAQATVQRFILTRVNLSQASQQQIELGKQQEVILQHMQQVAVA